VLEYKTFRKTMFYNIKYSKTSKNQKGKPRIMQDGVVGGIPDISGIPNRDRKKSMY